MINENRATNDDDDEYLDARSPKERSMALRMEKHLQFLVERERRTSMEQASSTSAITQKAKVGRLQEKVDRRGARPEHGEIVVLQDTRPTEAPRYLSAPSHRLHQPQDGTDPGTPFPPDGVVAGQSRAQRSETGAARATWV